MNYYKTLQTLRMDKEIPKEDYYNLYNEYKDDEATLEVLAANPYTPEDLKFKVLNSVIDTNHYQSVFWEFLLDNPHTSSELLDKMAHKEGLHANFFLAILRHPNVSEKTIDYIVGLSDLTNKNSNLEDRDKIKLIEFIIYNKEMSPSLFNKLLLEIIGPHSSTLIRTHPEFITPDILQIIIADAPNLADYIAETPKVADEEIAIPLSLMSDHKTLVRLAKNPHTPAKALENMWDLTGSLDEIILNNPNCPKSLKDNFIQHYKENRINKFRGHFKDFENLDLPLAGKTNTDLELLMRLKGHLHNA